MPNAKRGEIWQVDFGLAAKVRPALVLGCLRTKIACSWRWFITRRPCAARVTKSQCACPVSMKAALMRKAFTPFPQ